jgi:hypothetical protein
MVGRRWSASRSFLLAAARLRGLHLQQVSDLFDRFAESEPFAGPVVEFGGDLVQLGLGMHREVLPFGKYCRNNPLDEAAGERSGMYLGEP